MNRWHDEQLCPGEWGVSFLKVFKSAIERYLEILQPLKGEGNTSIDTEISNWTSILQTINSELEQVSNDSERCKLPLLGKNYGKLYDILWKQYNAKKQLLEERRSKVVSEAALEGAITELEKINSTLELGFWGTLNRHKALVDSFYPTEEENSSTQQNIPLQITIGNLYGQFAAFNNGNMVQNNTSTVKTLKEITDALVASSISDNLKQDALADVQAMQSQLNKEKPNRIILDAGLTSLQAVANIAQITSVLAPHFHKIKEFITSLPLIGP